MLAIYEKMQKEGKIGPLMKDSNGQMVPRPFEEFPKWVKRRDGTSVLVQSRSEELRVTLEDPTTGPVEEALEQENDVLKGRLAMLQRQLELANEQLAKQAEADEAKVETKAQPTKGSK